MNVGRLTLACSFPAPLAVHFLSMLIFLTSNSTGPFSSRSRPKRQHPPAPSFVTPLDCLTLESRREGGKGSAVQCIYSLLKVILFPVASNRPGFKQYPPRRLNQGHAIIQSTPHWAGTTWRFLTAPPPAGGSEVKVNTQAAARRN